MKTFGILLIGVAAVGCSPSTPGIAPAVSPAVGKPPSVLARLKVAMENHSSYHVMIEPMAAQRAGGSNGFGPPEETQPGPTKVSSKGELGGFFGGTDSVTSGNLDAVLVHVQAMEGDTGPVVKEAYVVVPRQSAERSPGTLKIKVDAKGVTWFGPAAGSQTWIELAR